MSRAQSGIVNRPPQHLILAALDLVDRSPVAARAALDGLANVFERELRSDLDAANPPNNKDVPSAETGELGFDENYDRGHLTITVGLSSAAFDALGVAADNRPSDLRPFPWDKFGQTPRNSGSGDFIVQVCSDDLYVCEHVVRRIEEEQSSVVRVVWTQLGAQRYTSRPGRTSREEGRALIGFLDGSSNLNPRNSAEDSKLVFVDPADVSSYPQNPPPELPPSGPYGGTTTGPRFPADLQPVPTREPDWTKDGSYMTVRVSTFDTTPWDDQTQNQQERAVGRFKFSGSSLDLVDERSQLHADPAFVTDQANVTVPLSSHVRKANPRRSPEDLALPPRLSADRRNGQRAAARPGVHLVRAHHEHAVRVHLSRVAPQRRLSATADGRGSAALRSAPGDGALRRLLLRASRPPRAVDLGTS